MADKCELYLARLNGATDEKIVRIDARIGPKLLGRIEVKLEDFIASIMGQGAVPASFTTERKPRTPT